MYELITEMLIKLFDAISFFLMMIFILYIIQKIVINISIYKFKNKIIYGTSIFGVVIHELSHLVFAVAFRHKVLKVSLLHFDKSNTLGYIEHSFNTRSLYQLTGCFFIGIAPLFGGIAVIYLLTIVLLPYPQALINSLMLSEASNLTNLNIYTIESILKNFWYGLSLQIGNPYIFSLWFYLVFSVSLHLAPSPADMKNSSVGVLLFLVFTMIASVLLGLYNLDLFYWIKQKLDIIAGFYLVSIVICLIAGGIILLTSGLIHAIQRKKERYIED